MFQYARWCKSVELPLFPFLENTAFNYVEELRRETAPPTRASAFKEALPCLISVL